MRRAVPLLVLLIGARAEAIPLLDIRPGGSPFDGPTEEAPTAAFWNPAALGPLRGLHAWFSGSLALERGSFDRAPFDNATGAVGSGASLPPTNLASDRTGYLGALSYDFGLDSFTLGIAVYEPWDTERSLADPKAAFSPAAAPAGYRLASENFRSLYVTVAAALRVWSWLDLGVSLTPVDTWTDLTIYRDAALDGGSATVSQPNALCGGRPCGYENPMAAQRLQLHGDGGSFWFGIPKPSGLGIGLGALLHFGRVHIGVSWTHVVPLPTDGSHYDRPYVSPSAIGASVTPAPGQGAPCGSTINGPLACVGGDAISFAIPDVYHLGARIELRPGLELAPWVRLVTYGGYDPYDDASQGGLVLSLSGAPVTRANLPERIVIAHGLRPSVTVELLGLRWKAMDRPRAGTLRVALSMVYQSPAVPSSYVDAAALDGHTLDATVGLEWRRAFGSRSRRPFALRLLAAAGVTGILPVDASTSAYDPRARVACVDSGYSIDACGADLLGTASPTAAGRYTLVAPHFTAGAGFDW